MRRSYPDSSWLQNLLVCLFWLFVFIGPLLFSIFARPTLEAIAVKKDGHILIVRSTFLGDRVEECTEDELKLTCQSYKISF